MSAPFQPRYRLRRVHDGQSVRAALVPERLREGHHPGGTQVPCPDGVKAVGPPPVQDQRDAAGSRMASAMDSSAPGGRAGCPPPLFAVV